MKQTLFLISIFLALNLLGQKLDDKVGEIEVQIIGHNFKQNSNGELTKRKTNKKNRPQLKMYFDSTGVLLKSVSFGKHHNIDLRLTNKINVFRYKNGKLAKSVEYESDYEKNVYPYLKSKYLYNNKGELIDESTYYYDTDSLFLRTTYEYDLNSNNVKSIFNSTYYYQREFDSINRITVLKQVYDSKLRWDWKYKYIENQRIGFFQTYYKDEENYSKKEIQTFDNKGLLIETEKIQISKNGLDKKIKIYYYDSGIIKRIAYYQSYSTKDGYEMVSFSDVKIKSKIKIDSKIAERINNQINIE